MHVPPIPSDEAIRLRELRQFNILDSAGEAIFDSIVELAATACNVPMSAISLVDSHRQWFKSALGLGDVTQTSRDISFCGHAITQDACFIVADAQADERFHDNPLVTQQPNIRFYAGAPLTTQNGSAIGMLCVLDTKPGELTLAQRESLTRLAKLAMRLIEARTSDAQVRESEQRFTTLADSAPAMMWMTDPEMRVTFANRAWTNFTGLAPEQLRQHIYAELIHPDDKAQLENVIFTAAATRSRFRIDWRSRNAAGDYRWLLSQAEPRFDGNGAFLGYVGSSTDITDERQARENLHKAEERLRLIVEGSNDAAWDWDLVADHMYYAPRWWQMLGYEVNELPADTGLWMRLLHEEDAKSLDELFTRVYTHGENAFELEFRLRHRNGHFIPVLCRGRVQRDVLGVPIRVAGANTDLTERNRVQAARNHALDLLQNITKRIPGVVYQYRVRPDGSASFPYASEAIRQIYRVSPEEVREDSSAVTRILHPEDAAGITASIEASRSLLAPWDHEYRVRFADGTVRWLHGSAMPQSEPDGSVLWHGYITDCTARKAAEQERESLATQLRESQKMQAVGTLAGGIAHDFNNITGVILGNVELARQDSAGNSATLQSLGQIRTAAERARDLTRQILSFSRRQPTTPRVLALKPKIEEVVQLLRSTLLSPVTITAQFDPATPDILVDRVQFDQVMINLLTNSAHAIGKHAGNIDIQVDAVEASDGPGKPLGAESARYARITVRDTGHGIETVHLPRIFEPFYTTKPVDQGTGLGLAVVYGIMQAHGGSVSVNSQVGTGSEFSLLFPAAPEAPEATAEARLKAPGERAASSGNSQRILYVDDDESLLFMAKRLLERRGHIVTTRNSADAGLDLLRLDATSFDLLLVDYNMPGMNGIEMAGQVRDIRSDLPIAVTSGFITDEMRVQARQIKVYDLIFKPNAVQEYSEVIERLLQ